MSLIAHYPLQGDGSEIIGGFNASIGTGSGLKFNEDSVEGSFGTGGKLIVPTENYSELVTKVFSPTANTFSFSCWVYMNSYNSYCNIIGKSNGGSWSNTSAGLWGDSSGFSFIIGTATNGNLAGSYTGVNMNTSVTETWMHLACTVDGTTLKGYIDGVQVGDALLSSITQPRVESLSDIVICGPRYAGSTIEGVDGKVAHLKIYDHALSQEEVTLAAESRIVVASMRPVVFDTYVEIDERSLPVTDGLVYHFPFDGKPDKILEYTSVGISSDIELNSYSYQKIKIDPDFIVPAGCVLKYDVFGVSTTGTYFEGGFVEFDCSDGVRVNFRGVGLDDDGFSSVSNLLPLNNRWHTRTFSNFGDLMVGGTNGYWSLVEESDEPSTTKYYFRNIRLEDKAGNIIHTIWDNEDTVENTTAYSNYRTGNIVVTDMTEVQENILYTDDGLHLGYSTTNIIPDGDFSNGLQVPYSFVNNYGTIEIVNDCENGGRMLKHVNPIEGESVTKPYTGASSVLSAATINETWTGSVLVRTEDFNTSVSMFLFGLNDSYYYIDYGNGSKVINPSDGWVLLEYSRTFTDATVSGISTRLDLNTVGTVYWKNWQLEKSAWSTPFVNGSIGAGSFSWEKNTIDFLEGTIALKIKFDGESTSTSWPNQLLVGIWSNPITTDHIAIRRGSGWAESNNVAFNVMDKASGTQRVSTFTGINAIIDHEFYMIIAWSASTKKMRAVIYDMTTNSYIHNDEKDYTWFNGFTYISEAQLATFANPAEATYRDLSIYNKYLSFDEIDKLTNNKMSMTQNKLLIPELTEVGYKELIPNYTDWVVGSTGSQGTFNNYGLTTENGIIEGKDPWGKYVPIWEARPDGGSTDGATADGGFTTNSYQIDNSKMYRISCWVKDNDFVAVNGMHIGLSVLDSSFTTQAILNRADGIGSSNAFHYNYTPPSVTEKWYLIVGHIYPYGAGTGSLHEDSGIYTIDGLFQTNSIKDYEFLVDSYYLKMRALLWNNLNNTGRRYFVYPRIDTINGNEPSIEELLSGHDNRGLDKALEFNGGKPSTIVQSKNNLTESIVKIREI